MKKLPWCIRGQVQPLPFCAASGSRCVQQHSLFSVRLVIHHSDPLFLFVSFLNQSNPQLANKPASSSWMKMSLATKKSEFLKTLSAGNTNLLKVVIIWISGSCSCVFFSWRKLDSLGLVKWREDAHDLSRERRSYPDLLFQSERGIHSNRRR